MRLSTTLGRRPLAAALTLLALAAVVPARADEPSLTIRIGYAAIGVGNRAAANGTSAATAHAGRYVEDELKDRPDVRVEWSFFKGAGPAVNEAIANGQLDLAYQGDLPSIIGRANGLRTKILLASGAHKPTFLAVPEGSDIGGIKDLRGRKVAFQRGTNNELAIVKILAASGLAQSDLRVINMDTGSAAAALAAGDVDAAFGDTNLIELERRGVARIAYTTQGDDPAFGRNGHLLVTEAFERAHPDLVGRVVKAFVRAARWSSDEANRAALFELWTASGTPAEVSARFFEGEMLKYRNTPLFDDFLVGQYRVQAEQAWAFGLLRRPADLAGWFDLSYLDAALKDLGLQDYWQRLDAAGKPLGS